ncbi:hypothetical protein Tco_0285351, partial [Tanacetum coccineum]
TPWKGVVHFGKKGKLTPRYVGPFEILERISLVAYRLRLPEELNSVNDTFHVSNLRKCLADANLHVSLNEIIIDKTLRFVKEPVEIMDREIGSLKRSKISLVKVRWNSKHGPKFTWECEDHMKSKNPFVLVFVEAAKQSDKLDWNNPEGDRYPFDLSKPLPLQGHPGHLTVAANYFFNNDLKYLKSSDSERTYTTSITKTKVARYEIEGIEGMVPTLWSPTKVGADRQFYKFKEGVFVDLHMNDIEDMRLLVIQHKLFHLTDSDIVDFIVALCMFTRSLVIKK